jgi:cytochrome c oxidase subunit 2
MSSIVNLAANYGWGPHTLLYLFIVTVAVGAAGILIVMATTRMKKQTFASKKKYHFERYWAIGIAAVLIWLWVTSYPWMPPVAFSSVNPTQKNIQIVDITAGQWFWLMHKAGEPLNPGQTPHVTLIAGQPVKFVAHSVDVNHGLGIFDGPADGSPILLQMQVVPGLDNIFYYTFDKPGTYIVRCLEYCGYAHPYMTSVIKVIPQPTTSPNTLTPVGGLAGGGPAV